MNGLVDDPTTDEGQESGSYIDETIRRDALTLSSQLASLRAKLFPPRSTKTLRRFSSGEAASLIGVTDAYLRQLSLAGQGPIPLMALRLNVMVLATPASTTCPPPRSSLVLP